MMTKNYGYLFPNPYIVEIDNLREQVTALVEALELIANSRQIEMIRWLMEKTGKAGTSNLDTKETLGQAIAKQALALVGE